MKRSVKLPVVAAALAIALSSPVMAKTSYPDVLEGKWYTAAVESAVNNGLLSGYEDGTMRPNNSITRAEIAAVLSKAFGATEKSSLKDYLDVNSANWFYNAMGKAVKMEIFTGDGNGLLNPNKAITREETAVVIAKAFELNVSGENVLGNFVDGNNVSSWAAPYVSALVENGYMSGNEKKELNPKGNITRAEFAQIMSNITNDYVVKAGTVKESFAGSVVVRVTDVTMKDITVDGDVIVADGVGRGDFTLDNVTIEGNLVVRGGGINSIELKNGSKIKGHIITRNHSGKTRIAADKDTVIEDMTINTDVIIDGEVKNVSVESSADVEVRGTVGTIDVNAENVEITGDGKLETVNANADNVEVTVKGANVVAGDDVTGVLAGDKVVDAGESEVVKTTASTSGGGAGGGSSTVKPTEVKLSYTITDEGTGDSAMYKLTASQGTAGIDNFTNKYYLVTISYNGSNIAENYEVANGADAIKLAGDIFNSLDLVTLIRTIDAKNLGEHFDTYAPMIELAMEDLLKGHEEEYNLLKDAKAKMSDDFKLMELYNKYEGDFNGLVKTVLEGVADDDLYTSALLKIMANIDDIKAELK